MNITVPCGKCGKPMKFHSSERLNVGITERFHCPICDIYFELLRPFLQKENSK